MESSDEFPENCPFAIAEILNEDFLPAEIIDKMRISLAGIARVTGVSELWLQKYVNAKYESVPQQVNVRDNLYHLWLYIPETYVITRYCFAEARKGEL